MNMFYPISTVLLSLQAPPSKGDYFCFHGNNPDICDQKIERIYGGTNSPTAIDVSYIGYCGNQGPYTYYCENGVCSDGRIRISFIDSRNYLWENISYSFLCEMKKK